MAIKSYEVAFHQYNFMHLTGIKANNTGVDSAVHFCQCRFRYVYAADCPGYYVSDDRGEMYRSNRNLSGTEQALLYSKPWKGEWDIHPNSRNQQIGRRGGVKGFGISGSRQVL